MSSNRRARRVVAETGFLLLALVVPLIQVAVDGPTWLWWSIFPGLLFGVYAMILRFSREFADWMLADVRGVEPGEVGIIVLYSNHPGAVTQMGTLRFGVDGFRLRSSVFAYADRNWEDIAGFKLVEMGDNFGIQFSSTRDESILVVQPLGADLAPLPRVEVEALITELTEVSITQ
jgi:hypothetical protein